LAFTVDQVRQEAILKVKQWYASARIQPAHVDGVRAWSTLKHIAEMHPGWRVSDYFYEAGRKEERRFFAEWEAWRAEVN
jgi:hypothetical protein